MALQERLLPRLSQPQEAASVDRAHPIGGALDAVWLPNSVAPVDLIGNVTSTGGSGLALGYSPLGQVIVGNTANGAAFTPRFANSYPLVAVAYGSVDVNNGWALLYQSGSGGLLTITIPATGVVRLSVRRNFGTQRNLETSATYTAGTPLCVMAVVYSDTDYRLFVNGTQANGTLSFGTGGTWINSMGPFGNRLSGQLALLGYGMGRGAPTDAQALEVTANPALLWQMFEPQRVFVPVAAPSGGGITGTLSATESGDDTAAVSGAVIVSGSASASEAGADTAAATGSVLVQGLLSAIESGADTSALSGQIIVTGLLSAAESGSDTASISGGAMGTVTGSLSANEAGSDVAAAVGGVLVSGAASATETGGDTAQIYETAPTVEPLRFDIATGRLVKIISGSIAISF